MNRAVALAVTVLLCLNANAQKEPEASRPVSEQLLSKWFAYYFVPLTSPPAQVITASIEQQQVASDFVGCPTVDELVDEFEVEDCRRRRESLMARSEPIYLSLTARVNETRYDFKRAAWEVAFTDDLGFSEPSLSVWKPTMPEKLLPTRCQGLECYYPAVLPRRFRSLSVLLPMTEADARSIRAQSERPEATVEFLVSLRKGSAWTKSWRPVDEHAPMGLHRGALVTVHAVRVVLGSFEWSAPLWFSDARQSTR